ncbi:SGNH/GDSL hydrolase family protein [Dactylosporangium sp. NPDC000244]|uniref:SGNH/GDSL hydrolase family protein n=1 Tax=Dactylosporangium sp. NPDC000244 TaxID=3154365 RepID=UPI00332E9CBF
MKLQSERVKRIATAAVVGGGGVAGAGALFYGLVLGQALLARKTIPQVVSPPPRANGLYGTQFEGTPVRLVVLGDSSAAGYGALSPSETFAAAVAAGLAEQLRRPVWMRCLAVVGAESKGLPPQVEVALRQRPDVAVICIGGNDVTHRVSIPTAVRHLVRAVRVMREAGVEVVVGTCPDLGTIRPIQPPLRWLARRWSRQMATAQTIAVVEAGGRTVSLGDLLGELFYAEPDRMFSLDRFHPSGAGYLAAAQAVLPTVVAALTEPVPVAGALVAPAQALASGEGVRALPQAAVEAAHRPGTEVSAAQVAGHDRGPAGRWAQLRRRVWHRLPQQADRTPDRAADGTRDRTPDRAAEPA